ncbi:hypothetical protein BJY16_002762 [Actinoplanes octamycinicus]|uniref:Uncharacterized protein n=1 Tax=Actinoplanes octamycinicus TaxID=135948 RepID=A0A7W7GVW2_9ACTN|nr:hypothetical protein [Actinoplanes octamycinicus]MBB4739303.1 hypothetical protein [Actinoplanes octamycinicus]GIE58721.1 hypothetical protein Aoc01nite_41230 [Actinoplanes octamycinicus]
MERGPMALFGAIVAVGLGPALWLGVQLAAVKTPAGGTPPATVRQQLPAAVETDSGGSGAGETETAEPIIDWTRPPAAEPPAKRAAPRPPSPSASPSPSTSRSTAPSAVVTSAPTPPSSPPTESATSPAAEPEETEPEPTGTPSEEEPTDPGPDETS